MYRNYIKRILDILLAITMLPFFGLCFIIIAPMIYLEDKGSIFYNAKRLGKDGKIFKMYKFRSMKEDSKDIRNEDGTTYNAKDDPRVTKIGRILRYTSLDELPQIFNVLQGDMSFIGPRPDPLDAKEMYWEGVEKKLEVLPGITGYSQAYYRNSSTLEERFEGDLLYANQVSFLLDLKILFKTIGVVFLHKNVYRN